MLCKGSNKEKEIYGKKVLDLPAEGIELHVYEYVKDFEDIWANYETQFSIFLGLDYLRSVEEAQIPGLNGRYLLVYQHGELLAFIPTQLGYFDADKSIAERKDENSSLDFRKHIVKFVGFDALIAGNMLVSGPYMYAFVQEFEESKKFEFVENILDFFQKYLAKEEGRKVNMFLIKDLLSVDVASGLESKITNFVPFEVEPMMQLNIDPSWRMMGDYLDGLTSKYRVRYKRAKKKLKGIELEELDEGQIIDHEELLYSLYLNVVRNVNFTTFILSEHYFSNLKKHLGDRFRLFVYRDEQQEIVAFHSTIHNGEELHAHFLGYHSEKNHPNQLYLNILYDIIEQAINTGYKSIDFGRTALEIKSSVGATPVNMGCFIKHKNQVANKFVPGLVHILNKKTDWIQRNPYKAIAKPMS